MQLAVSQLAVTEAFYAGILALPVQRSFTSQGAPYYLVMDEPVEERKKAGS